MIDVDTKSNATQKFPNRSLVNNSQQRVSHKVSSALHHNGVKHEQMKKPHHLNMAKKKGDGM